MQAEERYGSGGFICEFRLKITALGAHFFDSDIGNGQYQPLYQNQGPIQAPYYGATNA